MHRAASDGDLGREPGDGSGGLPGCFVMGVIGGFGGIGPVDLQGIQKGRIVIDRFVGADSAFVVGIAGTAFTGAAADAFVTPAQFMGRQGERQAGDGNDNDAQQNMGQHGEPPESKTSGTGDSFPPIPADCGEG